MTSSRDHRPAVPAGRGRRRSSPVLAAAALLLAAGVSLGACTGRGETGRSSEGNPSPGGSAATPTTVAGPAAHAATADGDSGAGGTQAGGREAGGNQAVTAAVTADPPADRPRVFNGSLDVGVKDLAAARQRAAAAVGAAGGFVADEQLDNSTGTPTRATATYRVPPDRFRATMASLAELGTVHGEQSSVQDVSTAVADVESRVVTLRTSIERLRGFLAKATDPSQITSLEAELTRREAEAASLEAQRRTLADQVAMATVVATWTARGPVAPVRPQEPAGFGGGLEAGLAVLATLWHGISASAGFLLPFLPVVVLAAAVIWSVRRRRDDRIDPTPAAVS